MLQQGLLHAYLLMLLNWWLHCCDKIVSFALLLREQHPACLTLSTHTQVLGRSDRQLRIAAGPGQCGTVHPP